VLKVPPGFKPWPNVIFTIGSPKLPLQDCAMQMLSVRKKVKNKNKKYFILEL
jgi:hypothetical protein